MGIWIIEDEHAPEYKPDDRNNAKEVKYVWPTARYVPHDKPAQKVR